MRLAAHLGAAGADEEVEVGAGVGLQEFFTGAMAHLHQGHSSCPMRPGHEWAGRVAAVGDGIDPGRLGRRVLGDTMTAS